jgi:elongation factor P
MPNASELRRGGRVEIEGEPYVVLDVHFQSPSARGAATLVKTKVRNLRTGNVFDRTFKAQDRVVEPQVELRPVQYLYADDGGYHFMDGETYDQFALSADELGDAAGYLKEGLSGIRSVLFNDRVISVELPQTIVLRVEHTDPAIKGATAQAQTKPATLETGLVIQVPAYLESGELVQVDTREARFIGRAKEKSG